MDKFFKVFFVTFILLLTPVIANAECNILIDGEELICRDANGNEVIPFVENGSTYVPVRAIGEAFDTQINWDQETKTVHIGTVGGTPLLSDNINIYADGEEFICLDANGSRVYPVLKDSTTFLPIRAIGQLFGKTVTWDNVSKTAILTSPPSSDAIDYLTDAIANTENHPGTKVLVASDGTISYNGKHISSSSNASTEPYSSYGFSLASFLPENYTSALSYLGNGEYFMAVLPTKLDSAYSIQSALSNLGSKAEFSMIYITLAIQGGYITDISLDFTALLTYNNLLFDEAFSISATVQYPEDFSFPNTPLPETPHKDNEAFVPIQSGENTDSTLILNAIDTFVKASINARPADIVKLLNSQDYNRIFGSKSTAQYNTELSTMRKRLTNLYENATGEYSIDVLVYVDSSVYRGAERAAKAEISIECLFEDEYSYAEVELLLYKSDGSWYIDSAIVENFIK